MSNKTIEVVMLVGLPGSGKSTFVESVVRDDPNIHIASTDAHIERIAGYGGNTYNDVFRDCIDAATHHMNDGLYDAVLNGKNIIWDQTNLTKKSRIRKMNYLRQKTGVPITFTAVDFYKVPMSTIVERNIVRKHFGRNLPLSVLTSMAESYETPTIDEGFSDVIFWG